jgi:hypothetical protein
LIKSILDKKYIFARYRRFYGNIQQIDTIIKKYNSSSVFIDEHLIYLHYPQLRKYHIFPIVLNTKLTTRKVVNIPPLDSNFIPSNKLISDLFVEWLWVKKLITNKLSQFFNSIPFLFINYNFFEKKYYKKQSINFEETVNWKNAFYIGLKNVPTIILAPKQLEFSKMKKLANEFYINLKIEKNESKHITEEYKALIEKIQSLQETKVIYCAFGTLPTTAYQRIIIFLGKLLQIISKESNLLLVVSTSGVKMDLPTYPNVHLFPFLPQLDMLNHCDLMITHGGLGSVKECLQAGVPMLAYPLNLKIDQKGNAARVVANGFGLRGDMEKDSEAEILRKIKLLLTQPFRKCREVDSEEKVMELLRDLRIGVPTHLLTQ